MRITDVNLLAEPFKANFVRFWTVLTVDLKIDARIGETIRPRADQPALVAAGLSKSTVSKHEFGRAVDLDIFLNGVWQPDDKSGLYLRMGFLAMAFGFRWGGNWDRDRNIAEKGEFDFRHIEDASVSIAQLTGGLDT